MYVWAECVLILREEMAAESRILIMELKQGLKLEEEKTKNEK